MNAGASVGAHVPAASGIGEKRKKKKKNAKLLASRPPVAARDDVEKATEAPERLLACAQLIDAIWLQPFREKPRIRFMMQIIIRM